MQKCPQCMQDWNGSQCQACGYEKGRSSKVFVALPSGMRLNGRYRLGNALSESRQAVAYAAWDEASNRAVLLEEFYPKSNATRAESGQVISKRSVSLFEHARGIFSQANLQTDKNLNCTDSFMAGGTAWRVYLPLPGVSLHEQAEALLDKPILFRDNQDRILMTINALPMPELPAKRGFMPSGSIARQRRRRLLRYLALVLVLVLAAGLGTWYLLTGQQAVSMTLRITLHPNQQVFLIPPMEQEGQKEPENITLQVLASGKLTPETHTQRTTFDYMRDMKPGQHEVSIRLEDKEEHTKFEVLARKPASQDINELSPPPKPLVALDQPDAAGEEVTAVINRLKDLGYLDIKDSSTQMTQEVVQAYQRFAKDFDIRSDAEQPGIYQTEWDELFRSTITPLPYLKAGEAGKRSRHVIDRLKELYYLLDHSEDAFDEQARAAYVLFLEENGLPAMEGEQVSVAAAKTLFAEQAHKKQPDVILGQSKGEKVSLWLDKLAEQGLLDPETMEQSQGVFTEKAFEAYQAFVSKTEGMGSPVQDRDDPNRVYLRDVDLLENAPKLQLPGNAFLVKIGDKVRLVQPGQEPGSAAAFAFTEEDLVPLEIIISDDIKYAVNRIKIALDEGVFVELPPEAGKLSLQTGLSYRLGLYLETHSDVEGVAKTEFFPSLKPVLVDADTQQLLFNSETMDLQAADDYSQYGAQVLPAATQAWAHQGQLFFNQSLDPVQKNTWQKLYEDPKVDPKRIQVESGAGLPSTKLTFQQMQFAQEDPFRTLYYGPQAQLPGLKFRLSPGPETALSAMELEALRFTRGNYTLSLYLDDQKQDSLLADSTLALADSTLALTPGFHPKAVREMLRISLYSLDGEAGLIIPQDLPVSDGLLSALKAEEDVLVEVAMDQGLDLLTKTYFKGSFRLKDQYGNEQAIPDINGKLRLEPGTYSLLADSGDDLVSQPLEVQAGAAAAFQFDGQVLQKMKEKALNASPPAWMYTAQLLDQQLVRGVVYTDAEMPVLSQEEQSAQFGYFSANHDQSPGKYHKYSIKFILHGNQEECPVQAVRFWYKELPDNSIAVPWQGENRNLMTLTLYTREGLAPEFTVQPILEASGQDAGPDNTQVEVQAAATALKTLLEDGAQDADDGERIHNFLVVDFLAVTKITPPPEGADFEFALREDAKDTEGEFIAQAHWEGDRGGVQDWVILPFDSNILLKQHGQATRNLKIGKDGGLIPEQLPSSQSGPRTNQQTKDPVTPTPQPAQEAPPASSPAPETAGDLHADSDPAQATQVEQMEARQNEIYDMIDQLEADIENPK